MPKNVRNPENGPYGHFPLGFWGKNFENFQKKFLLENGIKTHFRDLNSISEDVGQVYAPIRHIGSFEKILPKNGHIPANEKIGGCACWVHILGVQRGGNKVLYHTSMLHKYYWITPHETKVMIF